jgi:hypothetical protein
MSQSLRYVCAVLLALLCLPAFAAGQCPAIRSLSANDVQTGEPVTITWSYSGGAPLSQALSGHDFEEPVVLAPDQRSFTYTPSQPGEKHVQLSAVTACGTTASTAKYHVERCSVVAPVLTVSAASVEPGAAIAASLDLQPGHTVRWEVTNGTVSAASGPAIEVIAGASGDLVIDAYVSRGKSCTVKVTASVSVASACAIAEPEINHPAVAAGNEWFYVYVPQAGPGETVSFAVHGAEVLFSDSQFVDIWTPSTGSFSVDVIVTNATCTRTFTRTFEITPCSPTATVMSAGSGACDDLRVAAEFTGTAPFQGYWSDGVDFYTNENRIERTVTAAGNYTLVYFRDAYCSGTISGSAQAGPSLPTPVFTTDDIVDGSYYGNATCPGLVRTARINVAVPQDAEIVWTVENGEIVAGQGTAELQFAGTTPGNIILSAKLRNADGCESQVHTYPYMSTYGAPELTVSVEPATIGAGGTAIITTTGKYVWGSELTSSLGDSIVLVGQDGHGTVTYEYRSAHGGGVATITYSANNPCGQSSTVTTTLTIDAGAPVAAQATVRALGSNCQDWLAYAEFTGTAPFTGTWSNGETFVTDYPAAFLTPPTGGTYTLVQFSDANGTGVVTGEATFDFVPLPEPELSVSTDRICANGTVTATLGTAIPEGAGVNWLVDGGTILSGQGTGSIDVQPNPDWPYVNVTVQYTAPGACGRYAPWQTVSVTTAGQVPQSPLFDTYGVYEGQSTHFWAYVDPRTVSIEVETSNGDQVEIVSHESETVYVLRYTSSHGAGASTIRLTGTTECGQTFEGTAVMQILPAPPTVTLTSTPNPTCGATVTATFTGTAPFSGVWSDTGETFTTSEAAITRQLSHSTWVSIYQFADANGTGTGASVLVEPTVAPYVSFQSVSSPVAVGGRGTASVYDVPAGWEVIWHLEGDNARIVSGQGTAEVTYEGVTPGQVHLGARFRTPEGCEGPGSGFILEVVPAP